MFRLLNYAIYLLRTGGEALLCVVEQKYTLNRNGTVHYMPNSTLASMLSMNQKNGFKYRCLFSLTLQSFISLRPRSAGKGKLTDGSYQCQWVEEGRSIRPFVGFGVALDVRHLLGPGSSYRSQDGVLRTKKKRRGRNKTRVQQTKYGSLSQPIPTVYCSFPDSGGPSILGQKRFGLGR